MWVMSQRKGFLHDTSYSQALHLKLGSALDA